MGIPVDPTNHSLAHPNEDILEEYVFRRLPEALAVQVEEHLLMCHRCQDAVAEIDQFTAALKAAARPPAPAIERVLPGWRNVLDALPRLATSKTALAPVLALVILSLLVIRKHSQEPPAPVAISLSSLRGKDPLSTAPAGKPLLFSIEAPDLASGEQYRVEVVDTAGDPVWQGMVTETDGKLVGLMPKPLGKGVHWVRLYGARSELLREFGLSAK